MRLIFEDHKYDIKKIDNVLSFLLSDKDRARGTYIPKCVGYFYNPNIDNREGKPKGDIVFVLPKVLLSPATDNSGNKETLFNVEPEKLINLDWATWKDCDIKEGKLTKKEIFDFIYGFSIWIYRAIEVYRKNLRSKSKSQVEEEESEEADIETNKSIRVGNSGKKTDNTFMDILLSLVDFHKQHHDYIMYVMKMAHSGFNKINWTRTVTRSTAIIQDDSPVYLNPVNKRKEINFDEELLIIFYSILNYIHEKYGFQIINNPGYTLIKGKMFESYMKKQGKHRLLKIKYKYFSDTALKLWHLCYAFFDKTSTINTQANTTDYLLVNSFHTVFEAMIDELIGDKDLPRDLKIQEGGSRRVDSLYTYKYLMENLGEKEVDMTQKIYHIGDAKYHKRTSELKDVDIPKQFDYAKNVVQWHMDLWHGLLKGKDKEEYKKIKLYDDITKGFNIIPNFFVSAKVEDLKKDYSDDAIEPSKDNNIKFAHEQAMFGDQLFDRNTLFALHYDVRFLYVLKQYALNRSSNKAIWREKARAQFRNSTLEYLNKHFNFYQLLISDNDESIKQFVSQFYYALQGKIFSFEIEEDEVKKRVLVYAERISKDNGTDGENITIDVEKNNSKPVVDKKGHMTLNAPNAVSVKIEVQAIQLGHSHYELSDTILQSLEGKLFSQKVTAAIEILRTSGMKPELLRQLLSIEVSDHENKSYVVEEEQVTYNVAEDVIVEPNHNLHIIEFEEDTIGKCVIPLYTIRAACGKFLYNEEAEVKGWIDTEEYGLPHGDNIFVVQAKGHSMEPKIKDGDYCVFAYGTPFYDGDIILAEIPDKDSEYGGSFTIKKYTRAKAVVDGVEQKVSVTLVPLNTDYESMSFALESEDKPNMVGTFRKVIPLDYT